LDSTGPYQPKAKPWELIKAINKGLKARSIKSFITASPALSRADISLAGFLGFASSCMFVLIRF
jgi:hypothetical protein